MNKAEMVLKERIVPINSNEEAIDIIDEIAEQLGGDFTGAGIFKEAVKYSKDAKIKYLSVNTYEDTILIGLPMETEEDDEPFDILNKFGVLGYVHNVKYPKLSVIGYLFYKEHSGEIVRIG